VRLGRGVGRGVFSGGRRLPFFLTSSAAPAFQGRDREGEMLARWDGKVLGRVERERERERWVERERGREGRRPGHPPGPTLPPPHRTGPPPVKRTKTHKRDEATARGYTQQQQEERVFNIYVSCAAEGRKKNQE
jgi:hypothetical protein